MLKIYSWNVNGIRAVVRKELWAPFLESENPDIICLQETKAKPDQFELVMPDYDQFYYPAEKPGYSGTAILTKIKPLQVVNGLPENIIKKYKVSGDTYGDPNLEGRVMAAEFDGFWLVTAYTPNAKDDLSRLPVRQNWDTAITAYCADLDTKKPVIYCGDMNVAHTEDDLANPKSNKGKKGFTTEERAGFDNWLAAGFVDTLRLFQQGNGHYTWWSHFAKSRERNVGWRLDYFLASKFLEPKIKSADIHAKILGSDHCPVSLTLDI